MKKILMTISAVIALSLLGFGFYQLNADGAEPKLSADEIKTMVASQYPGEVTKLELEKDQNKVVYELEILGDGKEYELKLDGNSGEVLNLKEKEVFTSQAKEQQKVRSTGNALSEEQQQKRERDRVGEFIGICKAVEIAQQQNAGMLEEIELESDDGAYYYEVKIRDDQQKLKFNIDAESGEIMKTKTEAKNHTSKTIEQAKKQGNAMISFCQAADIAVQEHPGSVVEMELDSEDGKLVYEVNIYDDTNKVSMEIDALTGDILVIEIDD